MDAKKLESGFSYFEQSDLQSLGIGEAIVRIGSSNSDFNLNTFPLPDVDKAQSELIKHSIIEQTRLKYAQPKADVEALLTSLLPNIQKKKESISTDTEKKEIESHTIIDYKAPSVVTTNTSPLNQKEHSSLEIQKQSFLQQEEEKETLRKHRSIQEYIKTLAIQRGFVTHLEYEVKSGGRIDVVISKENLNIAFEVSVTNTIDYEVQNIKKCLEANYQYICMVSESIIHLKNINKRAKEQVDKEFFRRIKFYMPSEVSQFLDSFEKKKKTTKRVRGYRVKSNYKDIQGSEAKDKGETLKNIVLKSLGKDSKKKKK
jgi:hypothetical protein